MRETINMINGMVKVNWEINLEFMREILKIIWKMEAERWSIMMEGHIKDFGTKIKCMDWECSHGLINANLLAIIKMIKKRVMENFIGLMVWFLKDNLNKGLCMDLVLWLMEGEINKMEYGMKVFIRLEKHY